MSDKKIGIKQKEESVQKRVFSLKGKVRTEEHKENYRNSKLGEKNPMFGVKLTKEERIKKGRAMNSVERWNTGKNKDNDEKLYLMSQKLKGRPAVNKLYHKLINLITGEAWEADSLLKLSKLTPISSSSLSRLKTETCSNKIKNNYKLIW